MFYSRQRHFVNEASCLDIRYRTLWRESESRKEETPFSTGRKTSVFLTEHSLVADIIIECRMNGNIEADALSRRPLPRFPECTSLSSC